MYQPFERFIEPKINPALEPESLKNNILASFYREAIPNGFQLTIPISNAEQTIEREAGEIPSPFAEQLIEGLKNRLAKHIVGQDYKCTEAELYRLVVQAIQEINR